MKLQEVTERCERLESDKKVLQQKFEELQRETKELRAKYDKEIHKHMETQIPEEEIVHMPENISRVEAEVEEEVFIKDLAKKRNVSHGAPKLAN